MRMIVGMAVGVVMGVATHVAQRLQPTQRFLVIQMMVPKTH